MRDIKFRAWDKKDNLMYKDVGIIGNRLILEYEFDEDWEEIDQTCYVDIDETNEEYFKIMQYTGIKDINGKEIYEGDIVNFYNDEEYLLEPGIAKIDFDCGGFMVTNKYLGTEFLGDMDIDEMCIKVIGNIYENPELLKDK